MPQTCTICRHPERQPIEEALLSGASFRNIAKHYGTSPSALFRHRNGCVAGDLAPAKEDGDILRAESLIDHVRGQRERTESLYGEAEAILNEAKASKDLQTALRAIR